MSEYTNVEHSFLEKPRKINWQVIEDYEVMENGKLH